MNYCRKCQSDYSAPGTCNCFAPIRVAPLPTIPWQQPVVPYIGDPLPCVPYWRVDYPTSPNVWYGTSTNLSGLHVQ